MTADTRPDGLPEPVSDRCEHGVRFPHECTECQEAVPTNEARREAEVRALMAERDALRKSRDAAVRAMDAMTEQKEAIRQWNHRTDGSDAGRLVTLTIMTRHPQDYTLHNAADGTTWRGTAEGEWVRKP